MSYPRQYLRLRPRRGLSSDQPPWAVSNEYFSQGENVVFRMGLAERAPSKSTVYDPPAVPPYHVLNAPLVAAGNAWVYQGADSTRVVVGAVHSDITIAGGLQTVTDVSRLTLGSLNGVPFLNNSADEPMYWDGNTANPMVVLPDWTPTETCRVLLAHRFHLFALNISGPSGNFPNQVKWSDKAAPGNVPASWTPSATNEAGDAVLSDTPGELVSGANLRDTLMLYKNGSTHAADYIDSRGSDEIFAFRTLFTQLGALCRHAVADINGQHLVVADGDIVLTDGVTVRSIVKNRRRRALFASLDQSNFENLFTVYNRPLNEVWVCYPEAGSTLASRAMVYDVANDAWGDAILPGIAFGDVGIVADQLLDDTWDNDPEPWDDDLTVWDDQGVTVATNSMVFARPGGPSFLSVGRGFERLRMQVRKESLDFGDPERVKFVRRVYVRAQGDATVDLAVRVGTQMATGDDITWSSTRMMTTRQGFVDIMAQGRLISIEVAADTDRDVVITGIDIEAELRGYY